MSGTKQKTLNQKMEELNQQIGWFHGDEFELDKATEKYQEAIKLAEEIRDDLENLKNEVDVLAENFIK